MDQKQIDAIKGIAWFTESQQSNFSLFPVHFCYSRCSLNVRTENEVQAERQADICLPISVAESLLN